MPKDDIARSPLRKIQRLVTSHDAAGRAIFSRHFSEDSNSWRGRHDPNTSLATFLGYTIPAFPIRIINDTDVTDYAETLDESGSEANPAGIRLRIIDFPTEFVSAWRRSKSLDFCFVIEGEVDCILDSGETQTLKKGDVTVQRGTMHVWRNSSKRNWARMAFVLIDATPVMVNGDWIGDEAWVTDTATGSASI